MGRAQRRVRQIDGVQLQNAAGISKRAFGATAGLTKGLQHGSYIQ